MTDRRCYIAIDLKSFYASVECVERGLDPLKARLVVADPTRTEKTICLAVSPALKALGIPGRARLYEVLAQTKDFIVAPPRMKKYIDISRRIFEIYTSFVSPMDIHVYSIDEVFIDATSYLKVYETNGHGLALKMIREVLKETGITATAGVGTNMYLAKIAMDIEAKHMEPDSDGVRIAELDEMSYRKKLWGHIPLTDFWRVGPGYQRRLKELGIHTMGELARYSLSGSDKLYKTFGINAELLIDHAWGFESTTMQDIKAYRTDNHSLSVGQVLSRPYTFEETKTIITEMADELALDLAWKRLNTDQIIITIGYDVSNMQSYKGKISTDHYGRKIPTHAHGSINLEIPTAAGKTIIKKSLDLFERIADPDLSVRRIYLVANHVRLITESQPLKQLDFFTDYKKLKDDNERDERRTQAILEIKAKYGKNAILKGVNFEKEATAIKRHGQIGGHKA
ncbi:DNA methylase [Candidatus Saccharibacteria bacterium]|nr:DNA methylase [Candidatus Saccharibacteria bacterium]